METNIEIISDINAICNSLDKGIEFNVSRDELIKDVVYPLIDVVDSMISTEENVMANVRNICNISKTFLKFQISMDMKDVHNNETLDKCIDTITVQGIDALQSSELTTDKLRCIKQRLLGIKECDKNIAVICSNLLTELIDCI